MSWGYIDHLVLTGIGFIGSNFILQNYENYGKITVIDKLTYASRPEVLEGLPNVELKVLDLAKEHHVWDVFREIEPVDAILHTAAETHNDNALETPGAFIQSNVIGTFNLLQVARSHGIDNFVHLSTDETIKHLNPMVYGEAARVDEGSAELAPRGPYPASKAAAEVLIQGWRVAYNLPVTIVRPCNQYGPGQHPEKLIPKCVQKLKAGEKIPLFRSVAYRDWMFIEDCCMALKLLLETPVREREDVYHLSAYNERETMKVVMDVLSLMNKDESNVEMVEDRRGYDLYYSMDSSRLRSLGWEPQVSWEHGLKATVESYL